MHVAAEPTGRRIGLQKEEEWPRISLVTPVWNSAKYIEQTFRSILSQAYPNLEYIVVDGGSTDGTLDVVRKYEGKISSWISEPDQGMYDAINKGFARSSGEIMGWISATDQLHAGSLWSVAGIFKALPAVEWITGRPTLFNEHGMVVGVGEIPRWSQLRFLAGANRYIQQESTLWRRTLWERAGGYVDGSRKMANDFDLWLRFFRHARLHPVDSLIGGFRVHDASMGLRQLNECHSIHEQIIEQELNRVSSGARLRAFRKLNARVKRIPGLRAWWRVVERALYGFPGPYSPSVIRYTEARGWFLDKLRVKLFAIR